LACVFPFTARLVNKAPQHWEKAGRAVDFVKDNQLVQMIGKVKLGLGQLGTVTLGFQVQVTLGTTLAASSASVVCQPCAAREKPVLGMLEFILQMG
jgi:hypothetical protein